MLPGVLLLASCALQPTEQEPEALLRAKAVVGPNPDSCPKHEDIVSAHPPAPRMPSGFIGARKDGWVIAKYDVVDGKPSSITIAASSEPGAVEASVLQYLMGLRYRESVQAKGCVLTAEFRVH